MFKPSLPPPSSTTMSIGCSLDLSEAAAASSHSLGTPVPTAAKPPPTAIPEMNSRLEIMIRTNTGKSEPVRFSISGEVTAFEGENFLLIRFRPSRLEMMSVRHGMMADPRTWRPVTVVFEAAPE